MAKCLTLNQAKKLRPGQTVYHTRHINADGTAQRWRVSGQPKTWKKAPWRVSVPIKHGLYDHDHLDEDSLCMVTLREPKRSKRKGGWLR